jgi:hypothetical protein
VRNRPESTSTAPTISSGGVSSAVIAPKSISRVSARLNASAPETVSGVSYGLTAGSVTTSWRALAHTVQALSARSGGELAAVSAQKASSSSPTRSGARSRSADQASSAHTAPPDVPLRPTISRPPSAPGRSSRLSAPAVNAVWLPPPWHAMATRVTFAKLPPTPTPTQPGW